MRRRAGPLAEIPVRAAEISAKQSGLKNYHKNGPAGFALMKYFRDA